MKRKEIIERSTDFLLLPEKGKYTLDQLSRDLGCSKKTLYVHFRSKKELVREVFMGYCDRANKELEAIRDIYKIEILTYHYCVGCIERTLADLSKSRLYGALDRTGLLPDLLDKLRVFVLLSALSKVCPDHSASHQIIVVELLVERHLGKTPYIEQIRTEEFLGILTVLGTRTVDERRRKLSIFKSY